ncbi:hypothetical protein OBBRIDRAFT_887305 [Obba rivulosa]|uniref:RBR-type E3 ubiquitin transferase n=1 Tax=Obba rivulosa TaxID=1052685 RepID=A0A8E2DLE5_9APHY|nr:hypothetical protein OBBRIDRAFT_887305 [Obba rivulosa]
MHLGNLEDTRLLQSLDTHQRRPTSDGHEAVIASDVAKGQLAEYVVSYGGRSQYNQAAGGVSACGLAALNCARVVLGMEMAGLDKEQLILEMMKKEVLEEVLRPCLSWASFAHLEVEDIHRTPLFNKSLKLVQSDYGRSEFENFKKLLKDLFGASQNAQSSACVIITRPPEIIACLHLGNAEPSTFAIFDSHPRPGKHPDGAAFIFFNSLESTAAYVAELLQYDDRLVMDEAMQWQAQLLAHYSGHIFVASETARSLEKLTELALESSVEILSLRAKMVELESRDNILESENTRLSEEVSRLGDEIFGLREMRRKEQARDDHRSQWPRLHPTEPKSATAYCTSAKRVSSFDSRPRTSPPTPPPVPSGSKGKQREGYADRHPHSSSFFTPSEEARRRDTEYALKLQCEFDEEATRLRKELRELQGRALAQFECGICLDKYSEEAIATVPGCRHAFCRECLRTFAAKTVEQHRYPIPCPLCMADKRESDSGVLDEFLLQQLGLTEKQYAIYTEMEMAGFSIILHCRRCQNSAFVDKFEYEESDIITCPLQRCTYTWCKACSREIDIGGPKHSCDGSSELKHLMSQRGWKHCPGCQTPVERTEGCNHMTCMAPRCNTHFCYKCGGSIVQSVVPHEIKVALNAHYRRCRLFEDVPDR